MLLPYTHCALQTQLSPRDGEVKIGQQVQLLDAQMPLEQALTKAKSAGARFAIIGIAEDIGPRANLGRGGADNAFNATLSQWLNLQSNRFFDASQCLIVGQISLNTSANELSAIDSIPDLRHLTAQLDHAVEAILTQVFAAQLEPIIIGGGHNNAFPILTAAKHHFSQALSAINLDPHSDFRPREGRHSGNGFSYAAANGALNDYHILGLHELKNTEASLEQLSLFGATWHTFQQIWVRRELRLDSALEQAVKKLNQTAAPVGVELDVDAISKMPSSATTMAGIPLNDACHYLYYIANHSHSAYCHIAEAAPSCHDSNPQAGARDVGQSVSELIYAYIQGRLNTVG
ncbi:formimidoylglutamase [Shewanella intestini]|uniref:Formimidoylglutamase n=1 Tax=Shewanella intestini TaxID=2017544 RepID=A0ABS5I0I8_9GAMM|nr:MULTISPECIES: formimidoylglutamase [Shewanella]MBR9727537.1 formimidoylglutamase [Shewanella intestini]MRG35313.1 arginase [Shewanella sp. XMDDZSB0408]